LDLNFTGTPFVPIAIFSGNLDGQNHLISNVGAVSPYTTGIFPYLREGAVVRRLRIQNAVFLGGGAVGVIAGDGLLATVEDITATNVTVPPCR
jgi:hypothetical protein